MREMKSSKGAIFTRTSHSSITIHYPSLKRNWERIQSPLRKRKTTSNFELGTSTSTSTMSVVEGVEPAVAAIFYQKNSSVRRQPVKERVMIILDPFPPLPENFEEETWTKVKSAISKIFLKKEAALDSLHCLPLIESIREVSHLEMGSSRLYQRIHDECESHIAAELESLVQYQTSDSVAFLSFVDACWQDHSERMSLINRIMGVSALYEGKPTPKLPKLWDMGLQLFHKHLFRSPTVEPDIVIGLLRMVDKERLGEDVDKTLLGRLLKMFKALGIYSESFEKPFLEWTCEFYAAEGIKHMQHSDVPAYLKHVETRLQEEHERCLHYLDASTKKSLVGIAEKQLLDCHISAILDKGFARLMDGSCIGDLQRMYTLFSRVNALESLGQALSSYIRRTGEEIITCEEEDKEMVASLLKLKLSLETIWEESFFKNLDFGKTIKKVFEHLQAKILSGSASKSMRNWYWLPSFPFLESV